MDYARISKFISLVLRHKPEEIGIVLDEHGWANVDELMDALNTKKKQIDMEILEEIVRTDEKQRYSLNEDKTLIRANQGHSIPVGKRHGKVRLYIVKTGEMYRDGYQFYLSKNGVWLTKEVPVRYLEKQVENK